MSIFSKLFPKKKAKPGGSYTPKYLRTARTGAQVTDERQNRTNEDLTQLRYGASTEENIRNFAKNSPDVSHALESIMRFCITDSFTLVAKDLETDTINPEATKLAQVFLARINKLPIDYTGFTKQSTVNATSESLIFQLLTNGCCAAELVLDKSRLPSFIQPISTNDLKYRVGTDRVVPYIDSTGGEQLLDSPAVTIISLSQDPETPYSSSWFKAAIQAIIASVEFTNDLRRSFRKASLPRVTAEIDLEKFKESLTPEVLYDAKKFKAALDSTLVDLENKLSGLNPEDAIVNFDTIKMDHLSAGNISSHDSVKTHGDIINGQVSAGVHVLPSLLGRGESQSTASTETVLFLKIVESIQDRLNEIYSYLFTLAIRLYGHDVTVTFKYKKPSLRPEVEEESFLAMRQSRIREQLSDGFISDEEASIMLTGDLPSGNFKPLSGTGFHGASANVQNPYSNTSVGGEQLNNTKEQKDRNEGNNNPKTNQTTG